MSVVQLWLAGILSLGALGMVVSPDNKTVPIIGALQKLLQGTQHTAITGQA